MKKYSLSFSTFSILTAASLLLGVSACNPYTDSDRTVGKKIDETGSKVNSGIEKAGEAVSKAASEAAEKAAHTGEVLSDSVITASIKADLLKDPDLSIFKIEVDTQLGKVVLNGFTKTEVARLRAEKIASATRGVTHVQNNLIVKKS